MAPPCDTVLASRELFGSMSLKAWGRLSVLPPCSGRLFDAMAQPDHAAFQRLAANQSERLPGARAFAAWAVIVDDALRAGHALDRWMDKSAELVDQPMLEKGAVDPAAALKKEPLDAENLGELRHRAGEVLALWTRENIGGAILTELGQVGVRDLLPKHSDDVIAGHIVFAIGNSAEGIDGDGEVPAVPLPKVWLAGEGRSGGDGSFAALAISAMVLRPTIQPSASKRS